MTSSVTEKASPIWTTLPSRYYWAEDIFELEKERIFYDSWLYAGRVAQIPNPGDFITQDIVDESVIVVRDKHGIINAFSNVCRHRGNRLCSAALGKFRGSAISCGYHGWTYDLDGETNRHPEHDRHGGIPQGGFPTVSQWPFTFGRAVSSSTCPPNPEPFDPGIGPLEEKLGRYNLANLEVGERREYHIDANWKLVQENNVECYHCPSIHPELCAIQPNVRSGNIGASSSDGNPLIEGGNAFTLDATTKRPLISTITQEDKGRFRSTPVWPAFFLGFLPDHVFALSTSGQRE